MRTANVISGVVLIGFSMLMLFVIIPWQIDPAPEGMISTRLVPNLMMIAIAVLSAGLIVTSLRSGQQQAGTGQKPFTRTDLRVALLFAALFAIALVLYRFAGPLAAGFALVAGGLLALGERRPVFVLGLPVALLGTLWLVFYKLLGTAIV